MKVLVLGSGVIGVTSAWYLNQAGHEVTVLDRQAEPARETSFANGGQISWGAAIPWAAPGIPLKALRWMFRPHSPLVWRPRFDPAQWSWLVRMLFQCTEARYTVNRERMLRVSRYSHACLTELRRNTGIRYDERVTGLLEIFRDVRELDAAAGGLEACTAMGIRCRTLDRAGCVALEPALRPVQEKIVGGLHYPDDEAGDCRRFTSALAELAKSRGVQFQGGIHIERLAAGDGCLTHVVTDRGEFTAEAYVLACGSYAPLLLRPLGIRLPVYPVKGYSLTLPLDENTVAPETSLTDSEYKVVITRLGDRLRVAGTAELAGYDLSLPPQRLATLAHVVRDLMPGVGDPTRARTWCGLRPMTPDNPPVLGRTPYKNLFLNAGHGTLGWTMACGSGKILADLVTGRTPDIDLTGLTLARYS